MGSQGCRRPLDQRQQAHGRFKQLHFACLNTGDIQDVVNNPQKRGRRLFDGVQKALLFRDEIRSFKHLNHPQHPIHRRSDFMAHGGKELAFGVIRLTFLLVRLQQIIAIAFRQLAKSHHFDNEDGKNRDQHTARKIADGNRHLDKRRAKIVMPQKPKHHPACKDDPQQRNDHRLFATHRKRHKGPAKKDDKKQFDIAFGGHGENGPHDHNQAREIPQQAGQKRIFRIYEQTRGDRTQNRNC